MNILVGVDFSDASEKVLARAEELAKSVSAKVWLLHVAEPDPDFIGYAPGPQSVRDAVAHEFHAEHRKIQELAGRFGESGLDTTPLLIQGATAETILKEAEKLAVDVIVVGSHGHSALHHLLVGSVSEGVLKGAQCPVLVVPTKHTD
jgi:nucleotide-binding universal stress UspA family protein